MSKLDKNLIELSEELKYLPENEADVIMFTWLHMLRNEDSEDRAEPKEFNLLDLYEYSSDIIGKEKTDSGVKNLLDTLQICRKKRVKVLDFIDKIGIFLNNNK